MVKRVLVTGALGFIGINIVRCLTNAGIAVTAVARQEPDSEARAFLGQSEVFVRWAEGDVTNSEVMMHLVTSEPHDAIIHTAAVTPTPEFERSSTRVVIDTNLYATVNLLEAAKSAGVERFIYLSSSGVYASRSTFPLPRLESECLQPWNLYTTCKLASEALCREYIRVHGLSIAIVRLGTAYGPMERPTRSRARLSIINTLLRAYLDGRHLLVKNPDIGRDLIHVFDAADAILYLLQAPRLNWDTFNLAEGCARFT